MFPNFGSLCYNVQTGSCGLNYWLEIVVVVAAVDTLVVGFDLRTYKGISGAVISSVICFDHMPE